MIGVMVLCVHSETLEEEIERKSIEEWCRILEEKFDDPELVSVIMKRLYARDGFDRASYGHPEALGWARRVVREKTTGYETSWAMWYLERKGNAKDIETLPYFQRDILRARVAGTNVINHIVLGYEGFAWTGCYPSVANTGPQGLYVSEILCQAWLNLETETRIGDGGSPYPFRDQSKIPPELITMVVWFDEDGNPVCNVDLAKYGLTMPELDVPNRPQPKVATASLPLTDEAQRLEAVATMDAPQNRLYLAILATLCAGITVWLLRKRREKH